MDSSSPDASYESKRDAVRLGCPAGQAGSSPGAIVEKEEKTRPRRRVFLSSAAAKFCMWLARQ